MKTHYQYIHFEQRPTNTKTSKWWCMNTRHSSVLGAIEWYGAWRQYCFFPSGTAVFNAGCLADIQDFLRQLNEERKGKRKAA